MMDCTLRRRRENDKRERQRERKKPWPRHEDSGRRRETVE